MNFNIFKDKIKAIIRFIGFEIKRTTHLGKKMVNASKTNSELHSAYEELGQITYLAINKGEIKLDNPSVLAIIEKIKNFKEDLHNMEEDLNKIKGKN